MRSPLRCPLWLAALAATLAACQPAAQVPPSPAPAASPTTAPVASNESVSAPVPGASSLDVHEKSALREIKITFPAGIERYPQLLAAVQTYAQGQRKAFAEGEKEVGTAEGGPGYSLELMFKLVAESPDVVAVKGEGDVYLGGAHGDPLLQTFTWLTKEQQLLTAETLMADAQGWTIVRDEARKQLKAEQRRRVDERTDLTAEERNLALGDDGSIKAGTEATPKNFQYFIPLLDAQQKIRALRFEFPPYQVASYAEGYWSVEIPAPLIKAHVAPAYHDLFAD